MRIVQVATGEDEDRWDAYAASRTTTVTALSAWRRVVRDAYGMPSTFLAAMEGERMVGGLGLYEVRHPIFGRYLATAAFGTDGGFDYDDDAARDALLAEAKAAADRLDADYLLIRTRGAPLPGLRTDQRYRTAIIDLSGGAEAVWDKTLRGKTRNQIRKGMNEGFSVATGRGQIAAFHEVFHEHMRDLGSPAHSLRYYESIAEHLGDRADFFVVRDGSKPVAGAMLCRTNGVAQNIHTVALQKYNPRCPNYLIYWKMIEAACRLGCVRFDMGRSLADSPQLAFKLHWGAEAVELNYGYHLRKLEDIPSVDPRSPRYRIPIGIWRRLPLFATKSLGPRLITGLI